MKWLALVFVAVVVVLCSCTRDAVQMDQPGMFVFDTTVVCDTIEL